MIILKERRNVIIILVPHKADKCHRCSLTHLFYTFRENNVYDSNDDSDHSSFLQWDPLLQKF